MRLYLMQHGQATWEEHDPARPLTEKGRTDTKRIIQHAAERAGVRVARIVHSGKLRARQTAQICAEHLPGTTITEADGLDPKDSPELWRERAAREAEDVLVVGHLPHLARLAALLLCGNAAKEAITFENAGIVCLERADGGDWSVRWMLTPEVVGLP